MKTTKALLVIFGAALACYAGDIPQTPSRPKTPNTISDADQPFSTFQSIDRLLTSLDHDTITLRTRTERAAKLKNPRQRKMALRSMNSSAEMRDLLDSSTQLATLSAHSESTYHTRRQRYGAAIFRDLHSKAVAVRASATRSHRDVTLSSVRADQQLSSRRLLAFVMQFQAVSGGYGALACQPGGWACCQPRTVKAGVQGTVRGCNWTCASLRKACRGGCLGPRTPSTVVALQAPKPKPPSTAPIPRIASKIR